MTTGRLYSLLASIASVLIFNFLFTDPKFSLQAYDKGYPVTFFIMFIAASITGSLATRLKQQAKQSARAAYRTKVLFDTNQLLQQASDQEEIIATTSQQLLKLLNRSVIFFMEEGGGLSKPYIFPVAEEALDLDRTAHQEKGIAEWIKKNNKHAGAGTDTLSGAKGLYLAVRLNDRVYGVVGLVLGDQVLDAFENSILLSILGECALALENARNAQEKEEAAALARNEQIRANLLRAISHDLRTPLTSISGNASNLLSNGAFFDEETKHQLYTDIYDDAMWLINLVENLLAVSKIEEGQLNLHLTEDLIDDVIEEALHHVNRQSVEHVISVENSEEFLLAKMDARLIVQVIINLVDNAIKYTPQGSHIVLSTNKQGDFIVVSVADDGPGIDDTMMLQLST